MHIIKYIAFLSIGLTVNFAIAAEVKPAVLIGLTAEFGVKNSLSAQSVEKGILLAIDEINTAGGVLDGRQLKLLSRDDRGVPARGQDNLKEFATYPDMLAVFSGRFSPVTIEIAPIANELKILLLAPWSAADSITKHPHPNYVFRLSLKDSWAVNAMLNHARKRNYKKLALFLPNTAWGRSCEQAVLAYQKKDNYFRYVTFKYNWGETDFRQKMNEIQNIGPDAVILVSNESEAAPVVQLIAEQAANNRLPIISHWGIMGGDFQKITGDALTKVDMTVVQTFTFNDASSLKTKQVISGIKRLFGMSVNDLHAQAGFAHAYDLTYLLVQAINKAGTTDRVAVRNAMEKLSAHQGLLRTYKHPFSKTDHEALDIHQLFMGRFDSDGNIQKTVRNN